MMLVTKTVILNIKQAPMKKYFPFKIRGVAKSMYLHPWQITDPQNNNKNDIVSEKNFKFNFFKNVKNNISLLALMKTTQLTKFGDFLIT